MRKFIVLILAVAAAAAVGAAPTTPAGTPQTAIFAGGCFWSMQSAFENVYGVIDAVSGYTGGTSKRPNYDNYSGVGPRRSRAGHVGPQPRHVQGAAGRLLAPHRSHGCRRPVRGPGAPVPARRVLHERPAESGSGSVEGGPREVGEDARAGRRADREGIALLPGGGLSPGLPEEEPRELHVVLRQLGPDGVLRARSGVRASSWIPRRRP